MRREPGIDTKVAALRDPAAYAEAPQRVDTVETHMSWVFLTEAHAYKLKKPRRFDHLDFRSASARHFYCLEELRLNRRLAPAVYLDVVPLTQRDDAAIEVGGAGPAIDWLVKMRRLPAMAMLDSLIARGAATPADMRRIAARLARFYVQQPASALDGRAWRALLAREIDENQAGLLDPAWELPAHVVDAICAGQRECVARLAALLDARAADGRVVEGHGDLRPEHVCMGEPIEIIDALEFSAELRTLDCIDEVGFLALGCERAGAPALGDALLGAYEELSGDSPPRELVHFYQSCRAASRSRLAIRHLAEARYRSSPVWRERANAWLELAQQHLAESELRATAAAGG